MIKLIRPSKEHEKEALAFKKEFFDNGENTINGSELLDQTASYESWLQAVTNNTSKATVNPEWVVTDTYFAIDENERIVGVIDFRHELKGFLKDFGNSGYSVRPSERKKGYATQMLSLILERAKETGLKSFQLSAEKSNTPSIKTIIKNGGKYSRSFTVNNEEADVYIIDLSH